MKIVVCVKIIDGEINVFDACALEVGLRLSEDVTVVSMGPKSAENELKRITRLGAEVCFVSDIAYAGSDTLATSYILSEVIKKINPDLIICGRQSTDGDTAQVGPCISAKLGYNLITNIMETPQINNDRIYAKTRLGDAECEIPAVLTVERICQLRFPGIHSKNKEIHYLSNNEICADLSLCGIEGSPTKVVKVFENHTGNRKCKFIGMEELLPLIEEIKTKNVKKMKECTQDKKLKNIWVIGDRVYEKAKLISDDVKIIEPCSPKMIADLITEQKPQVVLWNADLWGRKNAPVVAGLIGTGLCADCTMLETDGEKLYMYRPARAGNVIAKIRCDTFPQMATVRTAEETSDIIVSAGNGVRNMLSDVREFADFLGAEFASSRGLVDKGFVDYSYQVGLTGKNVSPKIYIAVGISGAVHHTCAIEGSGTIIAINPDKNARIFEYADYGILDEFQVIL